MSENRLEQCGIEFVTEGVDDFVKQLNRVELATENVSRAIENLTMAIKELKGVIANPTHTFNIRCGGISEEEFSRRVISAMYDAAIRRE